MKNVEYPFIAIAPRKKPIITNALKIKKAQNELANIYLKEQTEYKEYQIGKIREDRQARIA